MDPPVPTPPTYDLAHLQAIHQWLFQDVYEWAGQLRVRDYNKGFSSFWPLDSLARRSESVFGRLASGPLMDHDVPDDRFLSLLSFLYLDVNHLHPFREGNGRAQRTFLDDVAAISGRTIAWEAISREENDSACAASLAEQTNQPLADLLRNRIRR
ncbi:Fic/DOC family protein [Nocardioides bruguierae]|uniref:protein adenylyltransferase n=1 Tax=Nocardioides bruguierae TaxID=2945102 RepID=A0A9X2IG01_9ACTN|nr:Fic family protein [Nocardioides bruguierae]MCM0621847.1 Fic family protein [Nocardioides bruguierae]